MLMELLLALSVILVGTKLAGHLCQKIGIPAVIGELLTGVVLGPAMLGLVHHTEIISIFAELGVILLMFLAGLESDLDQLKKYLKPSVMVAFFGILFPMIFVSGAAHLFNISWQEALFIGIIFSATSVSISVQVLKEYNRLDSIEGSTTLGAAVVDDIAVVLIVSIFSAFINTTGSGNFDFSFIMNLLGYKIIFFLGLLVFARFILTPLLNFTQKIIAIEAETAFALFLCFVFAFLSEKVGMSDVIGAFFIGLLLSKQKNKEQIEHKISTISYALFIPVFFVSIGLDIELSAFKNEAFLIIILTILATLTKLAGGYLGGRLTNFNKNQALIVGAGMVSRGEMALIIVKMGENLGLISTNLYSAIVVSIILTTLLSPLLIKYAIEKNTRCIIRKI